MRRTHLGNIDTNSDGTKLDGIELKSATQDGADFNNSIHNETSSYDGVTEPRGTNFITNTPTNPNSSYDDSLDTEVRAEHLHEAETGAHASSKKSTPEILIESAGTDTRVHAEEKAYGTDATHSRLRARTPDHPASEHATLGATYTVAPGGSVPGAIDFATRMRITWMDLELRRNVSLFAFCASRAIDTGGVWYWYWATVLVSGYMCS